MFISNINFILYIGMTRDLSTFEGLRRGITKATTGFFQA